MDLPKGRITCAGQPISGPDATPRHLREKLGDGSSCYDIASASAGRLPIRTVAPRLRGPERPVYQPRDQVFWHTALLDIELNNFLLTKIGVHEIYYNASGGTTCSSG